MAKFTERLNVKRKTFFRIEYISEKPKSKKKDKVDKTEITKECSHENNHRDGECSWMGCPVYVNIDKYFSESKQCTFRIAKKVVEGGMKELAKFIKDNGLGKDGKKLTDEEVAGIIEKLDEKERLEIGMDVAEEQTEINKKLNEDEIIDDDWEAWKEYYREREQIECLNCGSHNDKDSTHCWYCNEPLKLYNEKDISDELIQYTIYHKDGKVEHKWLTSEEYDEMWKDNSVTSIAGEK